MVDGRDLRFDSFIPVSYTHLMIKLGHERSEEAGMEYMATWLPDLIDHCCPVIFIDAKEPFVYL